MSPLPQPAIASDERMYREVRLGLVLYGGVSLAVYIHGVVREFFRAVHGEGVYRLIKALTDSDVVVDIVSGTSAGGVNGILLSYALCNNKDFADCAELWRLHGGILDLLHSPQADVKTVVSLLNSDGYYQPWLQSAFANMRPYKPECDGAYNSAINELDLYITGTDVDGAVSTQFDDAGHQIDVKNHRSVFLLKYRDGRKNNFADQLVDPAPSDDGPKNPVTSAALAKLARITSCFPVAFAPVLVKRRDKNENSMDGKLQLWGAIRKEACFLDGGVLDNKPFTYTIKAIFSRAADRDVKRTLFFVDPVPEQFRAPIQQPAAAEPNLPQAGEEETAPPLTPPNILQAVLASLITIPGYQSITGDLKLLADHNSKVQLYNHLIAQIGTNTAPIRDPSLQGVYMRSRLGAFSQRVIQAVFRKDGRDELVSAEERDGATRIVTGIETLFNRLDPEQADQLLEPLDVYIRLRRLHRIVYLIFNRLYAPPEGAAELTDEKKWRYKNLWKALNRQVKLYEVVRSALEGMIDDAPFPWRTMNQSPEQVQAVWRMLENAVNRLLDPSDKAGRIVTQELLTRFVAGTDAEWLPQETLDAVNDDFLDLKKRLVVAIPGGALPREPEHPPSVLTDWDKYEKQILAHFLPADADAKGEPIKDEIVQAYDSFKNLDFYLYPMEVVSGLEEKDVIETIRISARDAQKGFSKVQNDKNDGYTGKVAGTSLHFFSGFFKRSWRANDILWGRLDGLCQLVESLLDSKRLQRIVASDVWTKRVRDRFFTGGNPALGFKEGLDPEKLFPKAGEQTGKDLGKWLCCLLSEDPTERDNALAPAKFKEMQNLLIEAAQLEIVAKDLDVVVKDALDEQASWNRYQMPSDAKEKAPAADPAAKKEDPVVKKAELAAKKADSAAKAAVNAMPWMWQGSKGPLDPLVVALAAQGAMLKLQELTDAKPADSPATTTLGSFFKSSYKVGLEKWQQDIPTVILLEVLARALLALRTCILGMLGDNASRVQRTLLYKFGLDYPLRIFYALVMLARRGPQWILGLFFGSAVLSLCALAVGIGWWGNILWVDNKPQNTWIIVFLIVPGVILVGEAIYLLGYEARLGPKKIALFFVVAAVAAGALYVGLGGVQTLVCSPEPIARLLWGLLLIVAPLIVLGGQVLALFFLAVAWGLRRPEVVPLVAAAVVAGGALFVGLGGIPTLVCSPDPLAHGLWYVFLIVIPAIVWVLLFIVLLILVFVWARRFGSMDRPEAPPAKAAKQEKAASQAKTPAKRNS